MNIKFKRIGCFVLAASMLMIAGCGKKEEKVNLNVGQEYKDMEYPLQTDEKLTYWLALNSNVSASSPDLNSTEFAKELIKQTGVEVEFIHPSAAQAAEALNLLLASNDLPDIIETNWLDVGGGPQQAINNEYILPLNDLIKEYSPSLSKLLADNPETDKMIKTDNGEYYGYPNLKVPQYGYDPLLVFSGLMLRGDWLNELGLSVPETIDEWYTVLKTFKEKKGATAPLCFNTLNQDASEAFCGAFGIGRKFYLSDGGEIKYGPIEAGFKDYLATFKKWYEEGLIDANIANVDNKILDTNITTGKTGATYSFIGSGMQKWFDAMSDKNPSFDLIAAPYPVVKKGDKPQFGQMGTTYNPLAAAITNGCKNPALAAKFLDYGYSEKGWNLYQSGIEGVSYDMVDGKPILKEVIYDNPDGHSFGVALAIYSRGSYGGPYNAVTTDDYMDKYYPRKQQRDAIEIWGNTDAAKHKVPFISPTDDETSEFGNIMSEVTTYVDEMFYKFVFGIEPLENFDKYVETVKSFGIERALEIQNSALKRYNSK